MILVVPTAHDDLDLHVDEEIKKCLDPQVMKSFFLFAGAGSGKTRSLILALDHLRSTIGERLKIRGQKVAVITYTTAARDEIIRRTQFDSVIAVSTIHHFAWTLIEGFNHDIREKLRVILEDNISDLKEKQKSGRPHSAAFKGRDITLATQQNRLEKLKTIKKFTYNPDSNDHTQNSLYHEEVLKLAGDFVKNKPALRRILRDGYPYIFVDESQDTNQHIVEALFNFQKAYGNDVVIGFFGDMMQRIYQTGLPNLGENLPENWAKPTKQLNFRCPRRVITLINKVREATDKQKQIPCSTAQEGHVHMFVLPSEERDKIEAERRVCQHMMELTEDRGWGSEKDGVKRLILEHHMAARRMNFGELFEAFHKVLPFRAALHSGSFSLVNFFSHLVLPLWKAKDDKFSIARIIRASSPLVSVCALQDIGHQFEQLDTAQAGVEGLFQLFDRNPAVTFGDIAQHIDNTKLFTIPDLLKEALAVDKASRTYHEEELSPRDGALAAFLAVPFKQVEPYAEYVSGRARFDTHQGVKGLQFPRVMVIMDDHEARGFSFNYDRFFNSETEAKTIDSTRRLFYVTCSRAERSLALVAYTKDPKNVRDKLLKKGWFKPEEIWEYYNGAFNHSCEENVCGEY